MTGKAAPPIPEARVLVVDDELHVCSALARSLTLMGYRADEANSGREALGMLERTSYDVMVLDIRMPGMDGIEVMRRAHQMRPDLLVIVLTGHATLESAITAVKIGAVEYLRKPASVHEIAAVTADALQRRAEKLRRQHLLRVMGQALDEMHGIETEMRGVETTAESPPTSSLERFLRVGPVTLDREKHEVTVVRDGEMGGSSAELTATEVALLAHLMQCPGTVLSCRELAQTVLSYDVSEIEAQNIVRPHISRLRKKVDPTPPHRLIRTVISKGYVFSP